MHRDFTEETFENMVLSRSDTYWHKESAAIFRSMIDGDPRIPGTNTLVMRDFVYDILVREYMQLIHFWLQDDSKGTERTLALVDKLTGFANELLYSGIIDKGFDLGRYLLSNDIWKFRFSNSLGDIERFGERLWSTGSSLGNDIQEAVNRFKQQVDSQCDSKGNKNE
jgi:hypothetical protein